MRRRIINLVRERTVGALDLMATDNNPSTRRRIVLVTHLLYYGYCFNPVSFYFVLAPSNGMGRDDDGDGGGGGEVEEEKERVEAVVVEVSNTPWNEMHVYVLHPESVDVAEYTSYPSRRGGAGDPSSSSSSPSNDDDDAIRGNVSRTHRYRWRKGFHVSPFMTMDHDYDWTFEFERDRIRVEARMIRRVLPSSNETYDDDDDDEASTRDGTTDMGGGEGNVEGDDDGMLYFTAGFDVRRAVRPTFTYPLQLALVILRFPVYCLIIQLWIHYEALRLLIKGVKFIPHPNGSETGASRAIAALVGPVFVAMDVVGKWWTRIRCGGEKIKSA
ncbi:hypothetical protein ACHAXA_003840 [Cyclostephanos tholiformis]|uniref:Uncharacterized protein n=1 Tax=Cyclostephanos tholiformis TaxID=382380 RepID=A0ABD3R6R0_9STRA